MRPIHYLLLLLMSSALTCTKQVTVKMDPVHKRLVVHGYVATGEHFNVRVGRTVRGYTPISEFYLSNALVLLYSNGVLLDTLQYDSAQSHYASARVVAEANKVYTLKVLAPDYPTVEATDMAPVLPVTESLEHFVKTRKTSYGSDLDDVVFSFRDPAQVKNYYITQLYPSYGRNILGCVYSTDPAIEQATTTVLPFEDGDCIDPEQIFFTDKSFDGQLKTVRLSAWSTAMDSILDNTQKWHRPYLRRMAVSETFYNYYKYTVTLQNREELPFFTESTDSRGNVKEGYGLFTIYDVRVDSIH